MWKCVRAAINRISCASCARRERSAPLPPLRVHCEQSLQEIKLLRSIVVENQIKWNGNEQAAGERERGRECVKKDEWERPQANADLIEWARTTAPTTASENESTTDWILCKNLFNFSSTWIFNEHSSALIYTRELFKWIKPAPERKGRAKESRFSSAPSFAARTFSPVRLNRVS